MSNTTKDLPTNQIQIERFIQSLNQALVSKKGKLSQRELCKNLDITIGTMTKYLRGEVNPFDVKTKITRNLAHELGLTPEALYNFYETGEYKDDLTIEDVESWIKSTSGVADLPRILDALSISQSAKVEKQTEPVKEEVFFTDEGAVKAGEIARSIFKAHALKLSMTPEDAWSSYLPHVKKSTHNTKKHINFIKELVLGWCEMNGSTMKEFAQDYNDCPANMAFEGWIGAKNKKLDKAVMAAAYMQAV